MAEDAPTPAGSPSGNTSTTASSENGSSSQNEYSASAQTRFRFYEPQELVSEENKEEETKNNQRFSFYDDTTRQELAAVENIRKQQSKKSAAPDDSTDEILRSLQETEVQRLEILKTGPTATTTTAATPRVSVGDENGSNPYEDAIKEALDLLRKHRSPPDTPAEASSLENYAATMSTTAPPSMVNVKTPTGTIAMDTSVDAIESTRTPREQSHLLPRRMDQGQKNLTVVTNTAATTASTEDNGGALPPANALPTSPLEDLADAYEEHKLKAKQRQERMAQYASRLQEFKSSLPTETVEQHWPPNLTPNSKDHYHMDSNDSIPHAASHDSIGYSDISHSTKEQVEAEVQRGVERVLLAILERANASRGRASVQEGSDSSEQLDQETAATSIGSAVGDALIRAMGDLGLKNVNSNTTDSTHTADLKSKTSGETNGTGMGSKRSTTSVVDELLAEDEDDDILNDDDGIADDHDTSSMSSPKDSSTHVRLGEAWGPKEEKKLPDSQEKVQLKLSAYGTIEEDEEDDVDRLMDECLRSQSDGGEGSEEVSSSSRKIHDLGHRKGVLGPLSKRAGGTTGVVLDIDVDEANGVAKPQQEKDHSSTVGSGNNKGPFSNVVGHNDDDDSFDRNFKSREDRYSAVESTNEEEEDNTVNDLEDANAGDDSNSEATELMRTLCAHFLPFGVDQKFNKLIEAIPDWDESNPSEAGYRIIRLSRTQLQRVELSFEEMVNGLKQTSQRQLGEESGDAKFVRELQEVERLLDESEENRLKAVDTSKAQKEGSLHKSSSATSPAVAPKSVIEIQDMSFDEDCHPHFPGVKTTGKGEMGDLEYFHLPIIFKSHVTGFEPTKDMVLEPGNVVAGQYLVESELGSAAFSTAYRCIDLSTDGEDVSANNSFGVCVG
jgi:hypothetical protein